MSDELNSQLPDYAALQQLARALWRNGSVRGAALLVGAGFSRNATLPGGDTPRPPLWSQLLQDLLGQLYPRGNEQVPTNPLRIAEEYRIYFGQSALDDFIRARFPDRAWLPGPLHKELLELPWADVLTTNWDTLLERTAETVSDQVYEIVRTEADLPHARSPRIVKLHGTLGDRKPLIFAEEDYRIYPVKHAAFVNLARQVFIENDLVLLGFSGDDPNFLQWAGWVRDHLGGGARRIYLVGYLDLPPPKRRFLEQHNISPIDFTPVLRDLPEGERHERATQLFLAELRSAKPSPVHEWKLTSLDEHPLVRRGVDAYHNAARDDSLAAEILLECLQLWKSDRLSYPGWLVCPRKLRGKLRPGQEGWLVRRGSLEKIPVSERLAVQHELIWRRTVGFYPLDEGLAQCLTETVEASGVIMPTGLRLEFAVALMRNARFSCDDEALDRWGKLIESEAPPIDPNRIEAHYQRCLRARDRLDGQGLRDLLLHLDTPDPVWKLRKAALLAEIGEFAAATTTITEATVDLEQRRRLDRSSLWIKSRLGWADCIHRASQVLWGTRSADPERRWDFEALEIDPLEEIDLLDREASRAEAQRRQKTRRITPLFDPGHYRDTSRTTEVGPDDQDILIAYELDQLAETAGLPLRINRVSLYANPVRGAATLCHQRTSSWYLTLLRALHDHFEGAFEHFFGRLAIAQLPSTDSAELISITQQGIHFWAERLKQTHAAHHDNERSIALGRLRLMIMALARFTVRMPPTQAADVFQLALDFSQDQQLGWPWIGEACRELARCAANAIPTSEQGSLWFAAIQFPLAAEAGQNSRFWPEPVQSIWQSTPVRPPGDGKWALRVRQLIEAAQKALPTREQALYRLTYLHLRKCLTVEEEALFGVALWSDVDQQEQGIPTGTGLSISILIQLPAVPGIIARDRVHDRLIREDLQPLLALAKPLRTEGISDSLAKLTSLVHAGRAGLTPSPALATRWFEQLVQWQPEQIERTDVLAVSTFQWATDRLRQWIGELLQEVIVPTMAASDRNVSMDLRHPVSFN
jgi:SIR2-like domain